MDDTNTNIPDTEAVVTAPTPSIEVEEVVVETKAPEAKEAYAPRRPMGGVGARKRVVGGKDGARGGARSGGRRPQTERVKPEFDQKILDIRRVTRVVSGGRRFSFSVAIVIGDKNGRVGLGMGKSSDTSLAIEKAIKDA